MGNLISGRMSKGKIYQHAYVYAQIKHNLNNIFQHELSDFQPEFNTSQVFVALSHSHITIQLQTPNMTFATWLKTETERILNLLQQKLPDIHKQYTWQLRVTLQK